MTDFNQNDDDIAEEFHRSGNLPDPETTETALEKSKRAPGHLDGKSLAQKFKSVGEFQAAERARYEQQQRGQSGEQVPPDETQDGLAFEDPWDKAAGSPRVVAEDPTADPFDAYRNVKGHVLDLPAGAEDVSGWRDDAQADFGKVAVAHGVSRDDAQRWLDLYGASAKIDMPESKYGYDPETTTTILRSEWGETLHENLAAVAKFTKARPALAAYLDSTGYGNSPEVIRLIAAASRYPQAADRKTAQGFINAVKNNPKHGYWKGDKLAVKAMRIAYTFAEDASSK